MATDAPEVTTLEERIDRLEHELFALKSQYETVLTGWPNEPTQAQGFAAHRWQRRDGDGYQEPLFNIPEAPADQYYYGRHNYGWAQVVEEAPELTTRLSVTGWARASFGSDVPWIALDDVLANYVGDVPATSGAYARTRNPSGSTWTDFNALRVASLDSPQFAGVPTAPMPGAGANTPQLATTEWTQNQFAVRDYLARAGGSMTGPLITIAGSGPTSPGIGIGDNSTGFFRSGPGLLNVSAGGVGIAQFMAQTAAFFVPINAGNNVIQAVGDPAQSMDGLNLRTGDSRYAAKSYVDQLRAPAVVYDIPANVPIPGDNTWRPIASVPISIPRGGNSLISVTVSCNVTDYPAGTLGMAGIRFVSGTPERIAWLYGAGPPGNIACGFTVNMTAQVTGVDVNVPIEVTSLSVSGAPPAFAIVGGASVATRSQIVIVDLGPVPTVEEVDAEETEPSRAGRRERSAARPHHRRSA